jgi:hypothetical protein
MCTHTVHCFDPNVIVGIAFFYNNDSFIWHSYDHSFSMGRSLIIAEPTVKIHSVLVVFVAFLTYSRSQSCCKGVYGGGREGDLVNDDGDGDIG